MMDGWMDSSRYCATRPRPLLKSDPSLMMSSPRRVCSPAGQSCQAWKAAASPPLTSWPPAASGPANIEAVIQGLSRWLPTGWRTAGQPQQIDRQTDWQTDVVHLGNFCLRLLSIVLWLQGFSGAARPEFVFKSDLSTKVSELKTKVSDLLRSFKCFNFPIQMR